MPCIVTTVSVLCTVHYTDTVPCTISVTVSAPYTCAIVVVASPPAWPLAPLRGANVVHNDTYGP